MCCSWNNLSTVRVGGLSILAAALHTLDLSHTRLTTDQLQAIFTSIIEAIDLKLRNRLRYFGYSLYHHKHKGGVLRTPQ